MSVIAYFALDRIQFPKDWLIDLLIDFLLAFQHSSIKPCIPLKYKKTVSVYRKITKIDIINLIWGFIYWNNSSSL